ncbi:MAG: four helix bundle protein [Candidatus Omnitrophica bacterium]|nr:four helix bundle protein [Candidatus Omnitrophota bacterium]
MSGFKELIFWQRADELAFQIYRLTRSSPSEELYGMTSQIKRAAVSVASNIA